MRFTEEELAIAKQVDLCAVAKHLGYTVKRIGKYHTLKEMDSIRIYDRSHWFRWSKQYELGNNGGSQIDFLRVFEGMDIKDAVFWLLDFAGYQRSESETRGGVSMSVNASLHNSVLLSEKQETVRNTSFILPEYAGSNKYLYSYLEEQRGIAHEVVEGMIDAGLIYESKPYHNVVFVGKDQSGTAKFASMRGVFDKDRKSFKCDVAGNDKRYGFNVVRKGCDSVVVFEAAIDLMSYMTLFPESRSHMLALGMLGDAPLETFLKEHRGISHIQFCLDNDKPGRDATTIFIEKYQELSYEVNSVQPPTQFKDFNEWLVARVRSKISMKEKSL